MPLNISSYIAIALGVILVVSGAYAGIKIYTLEKKILVSQKETLECQKQSVLYESHLDTQTAKIESMRVDYNTALAKYDAERNKKAEVKYRTIYRDVVREVNLSKESSCEDTRNIINGVRSIDFSSL